MKVLPSGVEGVGLLGPGSPEFEQLLAALLGGASREPIAGAIPFSVIVTNDSPRTIALLGVRFDMTGPHAKAYSVIHYADTLRNPEKADFLPGTQRFVCAEPAYTSLLLRGDSQMNTRSRSNLDNLRRMLDIRASLDCVAYDDGSFAGPDTLGAFERLSKERAMEAEFVERVVAMEATKVRRLLTEAAEEQRDRARQTLARKLLEGLETGGQEEMLARAGNHRLRIPVRRRY